mmetsp:Transcript_96641/g.201997  ORF Transcript_96641/g.201997 Transcript_96641/m.201997 type:complete len:379 (+) Transcript_96641:326-1462(+)|eukprot:CAMPEP_0206561838 /NCGR_PEP_ID=MMETSP0325_2-20121206/21856_1 /ASSEMBLY_ACC=CAM_ASM_000347 /TAXON_ID=2866 /ORGANISM="Crypthecodinium cohnii, Strain Seligo" /LENGTH=378 /DNA_ID=CAMNT_0054063863 /DNA_START=292 /DNA_END=1428 /DNA_ORIENTATION=-
MVQSGLFVAVASATLGVFTSTLQGCGRPVSPATKNSDPPTPSRAGVAFVAIGDWGGHNDDHPTTVEQIQTAGGMNKVAREIGASGVFMLGDNFYTHGVDKCESPRFQETFEDVYGKEEFLQNLPFHIIAGNHDHRGSVEAQLQYKGSARWNFPATHYLLQKSWKTKNGGTATADIVFIDTVELCGNSYDEHGNKMVGSKLPGPEHAGVAAQQWEWLEQKLSTSTADFLWVAGHFPIYSVGEDGTTDRLVQRLLPLLQKYGAHYLSGHDHMMEHFEADGVQMFLAGAGRMCCYNDDLLDTVPSKAIRFYISGDNARGPSVGPRQYKGDIYGGFMSIEFYDDFAKIIFYTQDGDVLYDPPAVPKRDKAALKLISDYEFLS